MSGGSGCQQIKLFVFRPGFGTLSLHSASASLPVTLCLSLYLPLSVPFSLFFSPCLFFFFFATVQPPALPLLNCYSPSSLLYPAPPCLCSCILCACARWDWSLLMKPVYPCVRVCLWWCWSLLMKPVGFCVCVCICLLCVAQHDATGFCWWSFCLSVSADLSSLPEERQLHCFGGKERQRKGTEMYFRERLKMADGCKN